MANSIIICFAFVAGFIVAKTFVDLVESPLQRSVGAVLIMLVYRDNAYFFLFRSGTFWLYAADCIVGGIFTVIFVPETRFVFVISPSIILTYPDIIQTLLTNPS